MTLPLGSAVSPMTNGGTSVSDTVAARNRSLANLANSLVLEVAACVMLKLAREGQTGVLDAASQSSAASPLKSAAAQLPSVDTVGELREQNAYLIQQVTVLEQQVSALQAQFQALAQRKRGLEGPAMRTMPEASASDTSYSTRAAELGSTNTTSAHERAVTSQPARVTPGKLQLALRTDGAVPISPKALVSKSTAEATSRADMPAFRQLFSWDDATVKLTDNGLRVANSELGRAKKEGIKPDEQGRVTAAQAANVADVIMRGRGTVDQKKEKLKQIFGKDNIKGSDSGGHGNMIIIKGTPICIKYGEKPDKGTEYAKYAAGLAFRKMLKVYREEKEAAEKRGEPYSLNDFCDYLNNNGWSEDLVNHYSVLTDGRINYTVNQIARHVDIFDRYGPTDDMNAYAVGNYRGEDGDEQYVIMKSAFFHNTGEPVKGSDSELKSGNILAAAVEAEVNGGKKGRFKNLRVIGGLAGPTAAVGAFLASNRIAKLPDGNNIHIVSKKQVQSLLTGQPMTEGKDAVGYQRDAADKTTEIVNDRLEKLTDGQLLYLEANIKAKRDLMDATRDAFIGSGYMIVVPDNESQMPIVTHIDFAHWMRPNPPLGLTRKQENEYRAVHNDVLKGNMAAFREMLDLVEKDKARRGIMSALD